MRIQSFLAVPAVAIGLIALSACSSDEKVQPAAVSTSTTASTVDLKADYTPIPQTPAQVPGGKDGLDFGTLTGITTADGVVTLHVDRSTFYVGEDATAQGAKDNHDWIVKDTDGEGKDLTFTLDPKASIQAEASLRNDHESVDEREKLTQEQLLANMKYVTEQNTKNPDDATTVYVWLRHTGGADGPVTAIADQFIP